MNKLSLFMTVKNEAKNLPVCLESVRGVCDEIIVVDDNSTDDTVAVAERYGAKIFRRTLDSFTLQKGFALAQASGEWALSLDADEYLTEPLKKEISEMINSTDKNAFLIPRDNSFLGRPLKHMGMSGQMILRLCRREGAKYVGGKVHESLEAPLPHGVLKSPIMHVPYVSIEQYFEKFNKYTTLGAESMSERGKKFSRLQILRPPWEFFRLYILRGGFLDGLEGFVWAWLSAQASFIKYLKLWQINKNKQLF